MIPRRQLCAALGSIALLATALAGLQPAPARAERRSVLDRALRREIERLAAGSYLALLVRDCRGTHHVEAAYAHLDVLCELESSQGDRPPTRMVLEARGQPDLLEVSFFVETSRRPSDVAPEGSAGFTRHPMFATSLRRGDSVRAEEARAFGIEPFKIAAVPGRDRGGGTQAVDEAGSPGPRPLSRGSLPFAELDAARVEALGIELAREDSVGTTNLRIRGKGFPETAPDTRNHK